MLAVLANQLARRLADIGIGDLRKVDLGGDGLGIGIGEHQFLRFGSTVASARLGCAGEKHCIALADGEFYLLPDRIIAHPALAD